MAMPSACSGCGIILNRLATDESHCSMHDMYALNGFFTCCVCARNGGWQFFESSACASCKSRAEHIHLQKEHSVAAPANPVKEYPSLSKLRENSLTPLARQERFEHMQARVRQKVMEKLNPRKDTEVISTRRTSSMGSNMSSTSSRRRARRLKALTPDKRGEQSDSSA
ncbi:hypothetical protein GUITHDRAFT_103658 [Guillardia theta CCMP2712]|uniref:Uncharacterized protein n=1 Tax=Guillardia theta (strain CCMP2712) TaxID=905079 RepID=L1JQQ8_GUITC|nr:hypothetical protein GUITHDRAFT_103658 [Guillardia theta CCMP2712]EKX50423.1 hypothetical protein GUITHDRAFT_103658 [Guillardia theta CCMP2712]|mmetsp:Transcript_42436/g.133684  ORF Transcript_42436/g.133684 Transcript_42436/m.133684 type:complete len:168 (-) Transcript_42436:256-759(-)|eukprot:XP_005837403.1 hypothetical protein GUITHDRAFT_103658 [Guillardia theta CCMP2712]